MKSNHKAALLSGLAFPGLGQIYQKQKAKAAIIIILVSFFLLWLVVSIFRMTWNAMAIIGPYGLEGARMDPQTIASLHYQAWAQNWGVLAIIIVLWLYAILDALLAKKEAG
jgi:hypothetical protein